jgi:SulP family sulfate permease
LLFLGERLLPGRPVALAVVIAAIVVVGLLNLTDLGVAVVGAIPAGLPMPQWPALRIRDQEGIIPLAAGCVLLAYIEGVAAARSFADKHGYRLDTRREFLGLAAANIAVASFGGYPVAGGLSQTAVNEKAGARSRMSLVFASLTLAICLLFMTGYLHNLPKAVLAAVVLMAVRGLIDFPAMAHMWRVSRLDFFSALAAFAGVLLLGILHGILLTVLVSVLLLLAVASVPHVAFLGRIPGTRVYSDLERHPENEQPEGVLVFRPEASLIYLNADHVRERVTVQLPARDDQPGVTGSVHAVFCDLSASPRMDLAGARMLEELARDLAARGITMTIVGARGRVRDLLRAEGLPGKVAGLRSGLTLDEVITTFDGGDETG